MNITDVRYNAAQKAFEASVLIDSPFGRLCVPARVDGDISMSPARVTAALVKRARRAIHKQSL